MTGQQGELELRGHDLPVSWDGRAVTWSPWEGPELGAVIFICPPPKPRACPSCKSTAPSSRARGLGFDGELVVLRLLAFRCPGCQLDEVWDQTADAWWTLGPEDYGDAGSNPPADRPAAPEPAAGAARAAAIARARLEVDRARSRPDGGLF
jgi:hypothetical protein